MLFNDTIRQEDIESGVTDDALQLVRDFRDWCVGNDLDVSETFDQLLDYINKETA